MGQTQLSRREVDALLGRFSQAWPATSYNLLRRNCCHFSDELSRQLGTGPIPSWVTSLAGVGRMLDSYKNLSIRRATALRATPAVAARGAGAVAGAARSAVKQMAPALADVSAAASRAARAVAGGYTSPQALGDTSPQGYPVDGDSSPSAPAAASCPREPLPPRASRPGGYTSPQALRAGDLVEVYSNSHQTWCAGRVETMAAGATGDMVTVAFRLPGAAANEASSKTLPLGHQDLRKALAPGDGVEVYSNSSQCWCRGRVDGLNGHVVVVLFELPGSGPGELSKKELPFNHKELRRGPEDLVADNLERPEAFEGRLLPITQALTVGDWVEVLDAQSGAWCLGRVTQNSGSIGTVAFRAPAAGADDWCEAQVPQHAGTLRRLQAVPEAEPLAPEAPERPRLPWSAEEQAAYAQGLRHLVTASSASPALLAIGGAGELADARGVAKYLEGTELPKGALVEIWRVANPAQLSAIGPEEFYPLCRLAGHCQAALAAPGGLFGEPAPMAAAVSAAGEPLRRLLMEELLAVPPPRLPRFWRGDDMDR